jgi:hypothetical protein
LPGVSRSTRSSTIGRGDDPAQRPGAPRSHAYPPKVVRTPQRGVLEDRSDVGSSERPQEGHDSDHRDRGPGGRRSRACYWLAVWRSRAVAVAPGSGWTAGMTEIQASANPFATDASVQAALGTETSRSRWSAAPARPCDAFKGNLAATAAIAGRFSSWLRCEKRAASAFMLQTSG